MRRFLGLWLFLALGACSATRDLDAPVEPIGDFQKGFTVIVPSPDYTNAPGSRTAEADEWVEPLERALADRFDRFDGDRFYHLGVIVEGYILAPPGIPVIFSPQSALIFRLTVIEDATGARLLDEPERLTVLEEFGPATVLGSGLLFSKERQIERLSEMAARRIEQFLRTKEDAWFAPKPPLVTEDGDGETSLSEEPATPASETGADLQSTGA